MKSCLQLIIGSLLLTVSNYSYSDRYGIYEHSENVGGGSTIGSFFSLIGAIIATVYAYHLLYMTYAEHRKRKESGEKIIREEIFFDYIAPFIGYAFWALLISFPILMIGKWLLDAHSIKEYWYVIYIPSFLLVSYLRQI